jgi:hypothetical protein
MNCTEFRSAYSDFADGLLDELGGIAAHRHLSECLLCRRRHEAFQWGVRELRRQPKVLPSADFAAMLERRIAAEHSPVALALRQGSAAAATLMMLTLVAAGLFAFDLARRAAPPRSPLVTTGPLPVLGADVFRPARRLATHDVAQSPFAVRTAAYAVTGPAGAPAVAETVGSPAGR